MKRLLLLVVVLLLVVAGVMVGRATMVQSLQPPLEEPVQIDVDADGIVARFSRAITYATIANIERSKIDVDAFVGFHAFLAESYPLVHSTLTRETVNDLSLVYRWQGADESLLPVLLMGHMDVVPVIPGTEADWLHPPFGGEVADGAIWGRGSLDDKSSVMAIMEAVEMLVAEGFRPRRTIYLAFGHDEEVGGPEGAGRIAAMFAERGVEFAFVLDEGGAIVPGEQMGLPGSIAVIGIAEKGFLSLQLSIKGEGGHSSTPPDQTNIGLLAAAINRLEYNQFPARLDGAAEAMLLTMAPHVPFARKLALANLWLTRPLAVRAMLMTPPTASMVRTTTAVTMIGGGVKDNVLPIEARAVVNHRILPGETRASVLERVRQVVDDDRIEVTDAAPDLSASAEPSPVSDPSSPAYRLLARTLRQVEPDPELLITPYLVMGGTDAKYYAGRSDSVFRFLPVRIGAGGLRLAHGTNEHIEIESLLQAVRYMAQLLRNTDEISG